MSEKPIYKEKLEAQAAEEKRANRIDYGSTAFMLKMPYSNVVVEGPFRISNRDDHRKLIEIAKERQLYLWYSKIVEVNRRDHAAPQQLIDWDSIPEKAYPYDPQHKPAAASSGSVKIPKDLKCDKCGQECKSTSGYTLHMKAHERADQERAEKYPDDLVCPKCAFKCKSTSGYTLHMKAHMPDEPSPAVDEPQSEPQSESQDDDRLKCPVCNKRCTSTSGLTLHMKQHDKA